MTCWWPVLWCGLVLGANQAPPYDHAWCWEGKVCTADSQCKQPNGVNGVCCQGMCRTLKLGRGEVCGSSLNNPGCPSCDNNLNCVDAGTGVKQCQQQNLANGCACNATSPKCVSTQPCLPSGVCGAASVLPGGSCEVASQCYPNSNCVNSTCQPVPDGQPCPTPGLLFNLCGPSSVCLDNAKCGPINQLGGACNVDYECAPNLWCSGKTCANRTTVNCTGTSCVDGTLCNSGTCVLPRIVAADAACTDPNACSSGICSGGTCKATHFKLAGESCTADLDCPFGASCQKQVCTASGLNAKCDPTLGGPPMDQQCQGSNDLYCSCAGVCLPTDAAILDTGDVASDCELAKQAVSHFNGKALTQIDVNSLSTQQRTALATSKCCTNCNKGDRVSQVGYVVDCNTKTVSQPTVSCGLFALDPLAITNCPVQSTSDGFLSSPNFLLVLFVLVGSML